jgi:hypothetical protein
VFAPLWSSQAWSGVFFDEKYLQNNKHYYFIKQHSILNNNYHYFFAPKSRMLYLRTSSKQ